MHLTTHTALTLMSLCKHTFPQPPHAAETGQFGDCTGCGLTHTAHQRQLTDQEHRTRAATARPGHCPRCRQHRPKLFTYTAQPLPQHWDAHGPTIPTVALCVPCWSTTRLAEEAALTELHDSDGMDIDLLIDFHDTLSDLATRATRIARRTSTQPRSFVDAA